MSAKNSRFIPALALALAAAPSAHAFQLGDHLKITMSAFAEYNRCTTRAMGAFDEYQVAQADLAEDLDFARKEVAYSHYYNPNKNLEMRRFDSMETIRETQGELLGYAELGSVSRALVTTVGPSSTKLTGRAFHHLQDSAAPPHVVPVSHGLSDGFESYPGDMPRSQDECGFLALPESSLVELLEESGTATLKTIAEPLALTRDDVPVKETWSALFWTPSADGSNAFGAYGILGNSFGNTAVSNGVATYRIPRETYDALRARQLRQAIETTKRALRWISARVK
jgi:hypothetical protein